MKGSEAGSMGREVFIPFELRRAARRTCPVTAPQTSNLDKAARTCRRIERCLKESRGVFHRKASAEPIEKWAGADYP